MYLATYLVGSKQCMTNITKTANSPPYLRGVINLRGAIVPVVSLRVRLGMPDNPEESASCIALTDFNGELTGFLIDEISDVIRINCSDLQRPPESTAHPWIDGVIIKPGRAMVVLLNLEPFCQA